MKKVIFNNDCRPGKKPKYYTITCEDRDYVYSNLQDMEDWVDIMKIASKTTIFGKLEEYAGEYEIIELDIPEAKRVPNKQY